MKLPLSPLQYMLTLTVMYLVTALVNLFVFNFTSLEFIQAIWLVLLSIPVWLPIRKIVYGSPLWRIK